MFSQNQTFLRVEIAKINLTIRSFNKIVPYIVFTKLFTNDDKGWRKTKILIMHFFRESDLQYLICKYFHGIFERISWKCTAFDI